MNHKKLLSTEAFTGGTDADAFTPQAFQNKSLNREKALILCLSLFIYLQMVILSDLQKFVCLDKQFASFVMNWLKSGNIGKLLKYAKF